LLVGKEQMKVKFGLSLPDGGDETCAKIIRKS